MGKAERLHHQSWYNPVPCLRSNVVPWWIGFTDGGFGMVEDSADSLMAAIGGVIAPIFAPLGFGEWQPVAASISGFTAKEAIVSTMGVLANVAGDTEDAVKRCSRCCKLVPDRNRSFLLPDVQPS